MKRRVDIGIALGLGLAFARPAAAITHDADTAIGAPNASTLAFDVPIAAGTDRYLLAGVTLGGGGATVGSVTLGGQPLGFIGAADAPSGHCRLEWWGLRAPPEGMQPFAVQTTAPLTWLDSTAIGYSGVAGLGAVGAFTRGAGSTGPSALTIASAPSEVVLYGVCGWSAESVLDRAGPGQDQRWHWSTGLLSSAGSQQDGAASVTAGWTAGGPGVMEWAAAALTLRPTGAPVSAELGIRNAGCAAGGRARGTGWIWLVFFTVWALRRNRPGTTGGVARGTNDQMRLVASRALPLRPPPPDRLPELDQVTLARAKRGDQAAQAAIVNRYQRPVYALLWRMVGPQQAVVEDLTQETFLRVLRALDRFEHDDGRARMVTWILSIASRLAIDHLRACRPRTDTATVPGALPVALPRPDQEATRRALGTALVEAVEMLAPPFRAAFLLREVHGMSYEEIGQALTIDVGTVKSRLARARAALQAALAEMHDD